MRIVRFIKSLVGGGAIRDMPENIPRPRHFEWHIPDDVRLACDSREYGVPDSPAPKTREPITDVQPRGEPYED